MPSDSGIIAMQQIMQCYPDPVRTRHGMETPPAMRRGNQPVITSLCFTVAAFGLLLLTCSTPEYRDALPAFTLITIPPP
jgi:hypothetical protein